MDLQVIQNRIFEVRGCRVMIDFHLAELYQVETRALKQAVKRNMERFPAEDFMFFLTKEEAEMVLAIGVSQNVIPPNYNFGATSPMAFSEAGIAMLSSVLKSQVAIKMNIAIIRAFIALRQMVIGYTELVKRIEELEISTDTQFNEIYQALTELASKRAIEEQPRRPIGYRIYTEEESESNLESASNF